MTNRWMKELKAAISWEKDKKGTRGSGDQWWWTLTDFEGKSIREKGVREIEEVDLCPTNLKCEFNRGIEIVEEFKKLLE